jgi:hypothetical protein
VLLHPHLTRTTTLVYAELTSTKRTPAAPVALLRTVSTFYEHRK